MSFLVRDLMIGVLPETGDGARPGLQLCGEVTRDRYGIEFYQKIGRKGGEG